MTKDFRRSIADHLPTAAAWSLLLLLWVTNLPLFLCMPPIDDAVLFDLHVREILSGGVPYREVLETNPPAMLFLMGGTRWLLGDSSVALRAVDLAIFSLVVLLAVTWMKDTGVSRPVRVWAALACYVFYFSQSEWCHCQRDMWLLAPALAVLCLRGRQIARWNLCASFPGTVFRWAVLEGLVLGLGMWLKPMLILPVGATWLVGLKWSRRWQIVVVDALGLVLGVGIAAAAGVMWLVGTGAWPYFVDTFLSWNPGYVAAGRQHWTRMRFLGSVTRLSPWYFVHLPALGFAAMSLGKLLARKAAQTDSRIEEPTEVPLALSAAFYAGWLVQAFFLQHLFDYVQAPGVLLALIICIVAAWHRLFAARRFWILASLFFCLALAMSPIVRGDRLGCWWTCVTQGSTPEVRDRLRLLTLPDWRDLDRVAGYLRAQRIGDGELVCFNTSTIHLYWELGIRPATRYVYLENCLVFFPERTDQMLAEVAASAPRFIVSDLVAAGVPRASLDLLSVGFRSPSQLAGSAPLFPWSQPIVFRAGRYAVHRVEGPLGRPAPILEGWGTAQERRPSERQISSPARLGEMGR